MKDKSAHHDAPFVSEIRTDIGFLHVYGNGRAITAIQFSDASLAEHEDSVTRGAKKQLKEYFAGQRARFDMPLEAKGTEFQKKVWQALVDVPFGQTASYLDIAKKIGNEKACRAVGAANGKNPIAIVVPCHRVIGANGSLTGYAGGMSRKSFLLSLESTQSRLPIESC